MAVYGLYVDSVMCRPGMYCAYILLICEFSKVN